MRKKLPLLFVLALLCASLQAQLSEYYFMPSQGTYTPITGTAVTYTPFSNTDYGTTTLIPIGFTFKYNGTDYTQLGACTDGFVQLGASINLQNATITYNNLEYTVYRNVLAPLWDDIMVSANGLRYETSGAAPNRVFTIQWSGVYWNNSSAAPVIEFQLKLYETTNRIEFIYNQLAGAVTRGVGVMGMNTTGSGAGSFLTLSDASASPVVSYDNSFLYTNKKPATGQVYAFFIPLPCTGLPEAGTTQSVTDLVCPSSSFKLSVAGSTIAKNLSYQWQASADGIAWQDIPGATDTNYITQQTTDTWYRRAITCSGNTAWSSSLKIRTGVLPLTYAPIPFYEDFETVWLSNCAVRERPSLHFKNSVPSGNRSWRRDDDAASGEWSGTCCASWNFNSTDRAARFHVRDEFLAPVHTTGDLDLYVDCSPAGIKELRFRHVQTTGARLTSIWYSTDGGASFDSLATIMGWDRWTEQNFIIPSNSPNTIIRFRGQGKGYAGESDIGIDDVRVQASSCSFLTGLKVTDHHQNGVTVQWNGEAGTAYEYRLSTDRDREIGPVEFTTDTTVVFSSLSLEPTENYFLLYVRRKCSDTNYSSWALLAFNLAADCSTADTISCGSPYAVSIETGFGVYNLGLTDPENNCAGAGGSGKEKLLRFIPQVTGTYNLKITAPDSYEPSTHYLKDASKGCGPAGWTCLGTSVKSAFFAMGNLTAGKEYFLLIDVGTFNGKSETIEIECPAPHTDCVTGAITPAGPFVLCNGESRLLTVSGGTAWQWFRDGMAIDGAGATTFTATEPGRYVVAVTNGTCTSVSNTVSIEPSIVAAPVLNITGDTSICAGQSIELSTAPVPGISYQWQKNGTDINNATGATFMAAEAGLYTITADNNCSSSTSVGVQVTVDPVPPKPTISAGGPISFCQGNSVVLTSSAATGNQWYKDGAPVNGGQTFTANSTGSYTVVATQNGCASETSSAVNVTVKDLPPVPTITVGAGNTLTSSAATGNQWYKNDILIAGATGQTYTATASGLYSVKVTIDGCFVSSVHLNVVVSGIVDPVTWNRELIVFPNPVDRELFVRNTGMRQLHLRLMDMTGRTVYEGRLSNTTGMIKLNGIAVGVYQLLVTDLRKRETIALRIIKH